MPWSSGFLCAYAEETEINLVVQYNLLVFLSPDDAVWDMSVLAAAAYLVLSS